MKKVTVFAGSNSKTSINKKLAIFASSLLENVEINVLDLNDFKLPVYGIDEEKENGIPKNAKDFLNELHSSDGIILSLAEHNGNFTVAFKNIYDWCSRINIKVFNEIPMLLMATSPGGRGGASVFTIAKSGFPHLGGNIVAEYSLPFFNDNFNEGKIINKDHLENLQEQVSNFSKEIKK